MHMPVRSMCVGVVVLVAAASAPFATAFSPPQAHLSLSRGARAVRGMQPAGAPGVAALPLSPRRQGRAAAGLGLSMVQTPPRESVSIKELSQQMQTARMDMEQGEVCV